MQELLAFTPKDYWVGLISMITPSIPSEEGNLLLLLDMLYASCLPCQTAASIRPTVRAF
jgi:hypothetical protein